VTLLPAAMEHILAQENGKERTLDAVTALSKAFALAVPSPKALSIRDDVAFFQAVRAALAKSTAGDQRPEEDLDHAIRQIVSRAVSSGGVVDIFAAAGLKKPDISILSDEFLEEVRSMPYKNLAVETLRKLLTGEIHGSMRTNLVRARSFAEMLERSIRAYQNHAIETAQVIDQLIEVARQMRAAQKKGEDLGLTDDEIAFYDALGVNDSAVQILGDATLTMIARELVKTLRKNVTIDWTAKDSVKAQLRIDVKRILRKYHYPPDKQIQATQTILEQAELLCADWAETAP
jgi:type I restriction enzyme R subunit